MPEPQTADGGGTAADRVRRRADRRQSFLGLLVVSGVVLLSGGLTAIGVAAVFESHALDRLVRSWTGDADTYSSEIVLVTIGEAEFTDPATFDRVRPLRPAAVAAIVNAIALFRPRVLGVDLLTDHWPDPAPPIAGADTRIVWAAAGSAYEDDSTLVLDGLPMGHTTSEGLCVAIPQFQPDIDNTVRAVTSAVPTNRRLRPSMPLALHASRDNGDGRAWHHRGCRMSSDEQAAAAREAGTWRIRFDGRGHRFKRFTATQVLAAARPTADGRAPAIADELRDKTVLLGATFPDANDRRFTPAGDLDGVELLAHAASAFDERVPRSPLLLATTMQLGLGAVALALMRWVPSRRRVPIALVIPFLLALPVCYLAHAYFGTYPFTVASFAGLPAVVAVRAHYESKRTFDVAVSYTSSDRDQVSRLVAIVKAAGFSVFDYTDHPAAMWGADLEVVLDDVYRRRARFCLMFLSDDYLASNWTQFELQRAIARVKDKGEDYLLIIKAHPDVTLPPGVSESIVYHSVTAAHSIESLARTLVAKLEGRPAAAPAHA